jgi:hypothetical protein
MTTEPTATTEELPETWAVIELKGHIRTGGRISKDNQFGTALLRLDVPQPEGQFVTQLINPSSLYRATICDEALARLAAQSGRHEPFQPWELREAFPALREGDEEEKTHQS